MSHASPTPGPITLVNRRTFAVDRERLFDALARPELLARWWGPNGFTTTIHHFDFRVGGRWRSTMRGPDGSEHPNESEFATIERPARVVVQHLGPVHPFELTMTFTPRTEASTELEWRMVMERTSQNEEFAPFFTAANEQNFDRLAAMLGG